ncbi:MAG TPA: hypothetical protein VLN90_00925, partial [Thioalkalivibrio sp.]|nr:hypothetical protein [Thioalkalivibrio sp.]
MRRFNYLIGRLHRTGFTWLAALLMIMALLPFLSAGLQPLGRSTESLRDPASPLYGFHFQRGVLPSELAIDHLRKD